LERQFRESNFERFRPNYKIGIRPKSATLLYENFGTSIILEAFLLCRSFTYDWDVSIKGTCGNRPATFMVTGVMNVVTDLMVIALPLAYV
jgi:hypothetical protein